MTIDVDKIHLRDADNTWASLPEWTYQIQGQPFNIGQLLTNAAGGSNFYGQCTVGASTTEKTVNIANIGTNVALTANDLKQGLTITVHFLNENTAANPTLNINSLGAKPIYRYNTTTKPTWAAGSTIQLTYNTSLNQNGCWILNDVSIHSWRGACGTAATTTAKTVTCTGFYLVDGARISVQCTTSNTVSAPTFIINNTGAKSVYYDGAVAAADHPFLWDANAVLDLVYDTSLTTPAYRVVCAPISSSELDTLLNSF